MDSFFFFLAVTWFVPGRWPTAAADSWPIPSFSSERKEGVRLPGRVEVEEASGEASATPANLFRSDYLVNRGRHERRRAEFLQESPSASWWASHRLGTNWLPDPDAFRRSGQYPVSRKDCKVDRPASAFGSCPTNPSINSINLLFPSTWSWSFKNLERTPKNPSFRSLNQLNATNQLYSIDD